MLQNMMYSIEWNKKVSKFLDKHKEILPQFKIKIDLLAVWDTRTLDIEPLRWRWKNKFRLRIWDYRFFYEIREEEIVIYFYDAWNRWDVYK